MRGRQKNSFLTASAESGEKSLSVFSVLAAAATRWRNEKQ
jgi:hypothetical protein